MSVSPDSEYWVIHKTMLEALFGASPFNNAQRFSAMSEIFLNTAERMRRNEKSDAILAEILTKAADLGRTSEVEFLYHNFAAQGPHQRSC